MWHPVQFTGARRPEWAGWRGAQGRGTSEAWGIRRLGAGVGWERVLPGGSKALEGVAGRGVRAVESVWEAGPHAGDRMDREGGAGRTGSARCG